jgi:CubicO group peptidase (beta-lactamase class C family)
MKINRLNIFVKFLVFLIVLSAAGAAFPRVVPGLLLHKDPGAIISDLETLVPMLMEKSRVPGLQVALVRGGRFIWNKGFGVKNTLTKEPVTGETVFEAASLTKPLFAYVVMKLVDEKVLDLDTPLISYLPREKFEQEMGHTLEEPGFHKDWLEKITARHVLSHSSGMPHGRRGKPYPLLFAPGARFSYSADGYYFLQLAVEHLKGEKLEILMKKYALDPLGMKNSSMIWKDAYEKTSAHGHGYLGSPLDFRKRSQANAAASLYTTAADYARFVCAILGGKGLKKETQEKMLTPQISVDEQKGLSWTLGFGMQEDENGPALWQWGDYGISRNYVIAYLRQKTALVYLANSSYGLSICTDLVSHGIGGNSLGNVYLDYKSYDYPVYEFIRKLKDQGPVVVPGLLAAMKAKYPGDFSRETIIFLGSLFMEEKLFQEALALYEFNIKENPGLSGDIVLLARACLEKGDRDRAAAYYRQALETNKDKTFDTTSIDWALAYIDALEKPLELEADYLKLLAGDYRWHRVEFKEGNLYYSRLDTGSDEPTKLVAMSRDTFIIEGLIFFRLKFEYDMQGNPAALILMAEEGGQDRSTRDK